MRVKRGYQKNVKKKEKKTGPNLAQNIANLHEELLLTGTAVLQLKQGKEKTKCKLFQSLRKNKFLFVMWQTTPTINKTK